MTFTPGYEIFIPINPFTYTEGATMTATKTKTTTNIFAPAMTTNIFAPTRYRTKCPQCGYALAMADAKRDEIHCAACHRTSAIPVPVPEVPDVEILSEVIESYVLDHGPGVVAGRRTSTEFVIEYDGRAYAVRVEAA